MFCFSRIRATARPERMRQTANRPGARPGGTGGKHIKLRYAAFELIKVKHGGKEVTKWMIFLLWEARIKRLKKYGLIL
jgi:hypothetical protein